MPEGGHGGTEDATQGLAGGLARAEDGETQGGHAPKGADGSSTTPSFVVVDALSVLAGVPSGIRRYAGSTPPP